MTYSEALRAGSCQLCVYLFPAFAATRPMHYALMIAAKMQLELSKIEAGQPDVQAENFDLRNMVLAIRVANMI